MKVRPADLITVRLTAEPRSPTSLVGYLFDAARGDSIERLQPALVDSRQDDLECTFELPGEIKEERAYLVIEGQWAEAGAGVEMVLEVVR